MCDCPLLARPCPADAHSHAPPARSVQDVSPAESYERIKMRSRDCECNLPIEYLEKLSRAYEDFLEDISQVIPVLRVDWSTFRTAEDMAKMIQQQYAAMRSIRRVDWDIPAAPAAAPTTPVATAAKPRWDADGATAASEVVDGETPVAPMPSLDDGVASSPVAVGSESPN